MPSPDYGRLFSGQTLDQLAPPVAPIYTTDATTPIFDRLLPTYQPTDPKRQVLRDAHCSVSSAWASWDAMQSVDNYDDVRRAFYRFRVVCRRYRVGVHDTAPSEGAFSLRYYDESHDLSLMVAVHQAFQHASSTFEYVMVSPGTTIVVGEAVQRFMRVVAGTSVRLLASVTGVPASPQTYVLQYIKCLQKYGRSLQLAASLLSKLDRRNYKRAYLPATVSSAHRFFARYMSVLRRIMRAAVDADRGSAPSFEDIPTASAAAAPAVDQDLLPVLFYAAVYFQYFDASREDTLAIVGLFCDRWLRSRFNPFRVDVALPVFSKERIASTVTSSAFTRNYQLHADSDSFALTVTDNNNTAHRAAVQMITSLDKHVDKTKALDYIDHLGKRAKKE